MPADDVGKLGHREEQIVEMRDRGIPWNAIVQSEQVSTCVYRNIHQQARQKQAGAKCSECGRPVLDHPLGHDNFLRSDENDAFDGEYVCRDYMTDDDPEDVLDVFAGAVEGKQCGVKFCSGRPVAERGDRVVCDRVFFSEDDDRAFRDE